MLQGFFEGSVVGNFSISEGFSLEADLEPIDLSIGEFPILKISGSGGSGKAKMDVVIPLLNGQKQLKIYVDGSVTVLGITRTVTVNVTADGQIDFLIEGSMFDVLSASLHVYGDVSDNPKGGSLTVEAKFKSNLIESITEGSKVIVDNLVGGALNGLNQVKTDLQNKRNDFQIFKKLLFLFFKLRY